MALFRRSLVRLAAGLAAAAVACGAAHAETVLRARLNADILSTNPGVRRDENTDAVLMHVVEGLVASREDTSVGPMLANRWDVLDNGKTYLFHLRSGVTFHNGAPLTAADAVWSLQRYVSLGPRWRCGGDLRSLATVEEISAPTPMTVRVRLDRPAPMFLKTLARADCGGAGIMHRASVAPDGTWRGPIGTGPFRMGTWRRNQSIELTRFERYSALPGPMDGNGGGKAALVDKVRFLIIPDGSSARAALLRGSLDVLDAVAPAELAGIKGKRGVRIEIASTLDFYALLIQTRDPLLKDARLRRAIALTIDAPALTRAITWGTARADSSPTPTSSPYYKGRTAVMRKVDLAEARRLAKAAGYRGQPIGLIANHRYPQMFDAAVLIQAMAREAGINLRIDTLDWASQNNRYLSGDYQLMSHAFSARLDPALNFGVLIGDKRDDPRKVWDTPQARDLLRQSMETADPVARQAAFDALQTAFIADTPAVVLFNSARITAVRTNVVGYKGWPAAQQRLWGVALR